MVPARPTGQTALSAARNLQKFAALLLQIWVLEAPREARRLRRLLLESGDPNFCRFRAAEGA
eukprot:15464557-Alexandrium_andersonii.AAC.1